LFQAAIELEDGSRLLDGLRSLSVLAFKAAKFLAERGDGFG
jgi:hypothetical protein